MNEPIRTQSIISTTASVADRLKSLSKEKDIPLVSIIEQALDSLEREPSFSSDVHSVLRDPSDGDRLVFDVHDGWRVAQRKGIVLGVEHGT